MPEHQEKRDNVVRLESKEIRAFQEKRVTVGLEGHLDLLDQVVTKDRLAQRDHKVSEDLLDLLERLVHLESQERMGHPVRLVILVQGA